MLTLSTFYKSRAWTNFRDRVIFNRTREDGLCYCELCGKPITNKIVCHHIEELTEWNVNDPDISLNEDNISLLHIDCHNKLHDRFQSYKQEIILVYGPPPSYLDYVEREAGLNDIVISLDYIYKAINPQFYLYPHTRAMVSFANDIVKKQFLEWAKYRTGKWQRCFICGGYYNKNERERLKKELAIDREVFIDISKEEAYAIAKQYNVQPQYYKYIDEWYEKIVRP